MQFTLPRKRGTGKRLQVAVLVGVIVIISTLWMTAFAHLSRSWHASWDRAQATAEQLSRTAEGILNRQLLQADGALASLPAMLRYPRAGADDFNLQSAAQLLRALNFQHFAVRDLILARTDGQVLASTRTGSRVRQIFFDQEVERISSRAGATALAGPIRNAATGEWVVYLVRPLRMKGADGILSVAELPITMLTSPLASITQRDGYTLRLERTGGALVAAVPHDELALGQISPVTGDHRSEAPIMVPSGAPNPSAVAVWRLSLVDDLGILLRIDDSAVTAEWREDRAYLLAILIAATAMILAVAFGLHLVLAHQGRLETEREHAQSTLEDALETMSDGFVLWDADDRLVAFNEKYLGMYEKTAPFLVPGTSFGDIMRKGAASGQYPQAGDDLEAFVAAAIAWRQAGSGCLERLLPDGRWLMVTERRTRSGGYVGIRTDITELKTTLNELAETRERAEETMAALAEQHRRFEAALNNMSQGLLMGDQSGLIVVGNGRFADLFGLPTTQKLVGQTLDALFEQLAAQAADPEFIRSLGQRQHDLLAAGGLGSFVLVGKDHRAYAVAHRPLPDGGFIATYEDVSEDHQTKQQMRHQALHDALTGLPNRTSFRDEVAKRLTTTVDSGTQVALLYLDLDRFKEVNDTRGHPIGDALLIDAAERLRHCVRPTDLIARLGGDEFAIAVTAPQATAVAKALAERILRQLEEDFVIEGHRISIGVSIGAAIATCPMVDADMLLKNADLALYESKGRGRGCYSVFEPQLAERLRNRVDLEAALRRAVDANAFGLVYQPIVSMVDEAVTGFETLLRWTDPERGPISPMSFIPIAEETGLIVPIGRMVLRQACAEAALMPGAPRIAVNISPAQLRETRFATEVMSALEDAGLPPERLELEITETALLQDDEAILFSLRDLREQGVRIALDDFGIGYSSFNHVRRVPLSKLKIDQVFVRDAVNRPDCRAIVRAVVSLARELRITCTAEGIENEEQLELMRDLGCDEGQGYLFGKPSSLLQTPHFLSRRVARPARERRRAS